ncbi:MAG TPA: phage-shock protein [Candidatus Hydrogenedentes bacterium]|nr:phage-shock protein [Candidatus Hydrogenedentota bacterium]
MMSTGMVVVLMIFSIPLVIIIGGLGLAALKILKSDGGRKASASAAEEARLIQELHHGFRRMEERVEALETILLEQERKETSNDS